SCEDHARADGGDRVSGSPHVRIGSQADIPLIPSNVRFTPESGHVRCKRECTPWARSGHWPLFNHIVSPCYEHRRKLQPEGAGRANVNLEFELHRLLNRKIARLGALEDLFDQTCDTTIEIMKTRSKCHQTARIHHFP